MNVATVRTASARDVVRDPGLGRVTVRLACGDPRGSWRCLTHGETFRGQAARDSHVKQPGDHRMAWVCPVHGLEEP